MNIEITKNFIRGWLIVMIFIALVTIQGIQDQRQSHQMILMLSVMGLFSLIVKNIWVTAFMLWTIFLFSFFKFQGDTYLSNVFFGCILYFITKISFKKEHINLYINGFFWFIFANLAYMTVQRTGFDFIYTSTLQNVYPIQHVSNTKMDGFMGHRSIVGSLLAMGVPFLAARESLMAKIASVGLLIVLVFCNTSLCLLMGLIGLLFVLYYHLNRKILIGITILILAIGLLYLNKVDKLGTERFIMWKKVMQDYMIHPVTGYGLDSFANETKFKRFRYSQAIKDFRYGDKNSDERITNIDIWDNPHNLYISILYEFGFIGMVIFICYMRQNILNYVKSIIKNDLHRLLKIIFS